MSTLNVHCVGFLGFLISEMAYAFHNIFMEFISMFSLVSKYLSLQIIVFL